MEESAPQPGSLRNQLVGQRIGSYRILDVLGSGGMSTVYRAVHVDTGHEVALKVLLGSISRSSTLLQRFLREARSAETLEHTNIVTIYDRGVDQGRHYLVLEYVAGGDFHEYVQRNGPLGAGEAIAVIRGVASGLRYAAGRGVIHRDIKPSNLLRTPGGEPKIIDLGLALQSQFEDERVTREGTTVGTVDYMAPEQARDSRATSIQSDMYSLGCTFYYLLAGVPPYPGGDITEKLTRHARAPAPDIRDLRHDIPPEVSAIVLKMMAKQPEERYADYDQLIATLDAVGLAGGEAEAEIDLVPLEAESPAEAKVAPSERGGVRSAVAGRSPGPDDDMGPMLLEPLEGLSLELSDERGPGARRENGTGAEAPLPRSGRAPRLDEDDEPADEPAVEDLPAPGGEVVIPRWLWQTGIVAALAVLLVVGLHLIIGGPRAEDRSLVEVPSPEAEPIPPRSVARGGRSPGTNSSLPGVGSSSRKAAASPTKPVAPTSPSWIEPDDKDPVPGDPGPLPADAQLRRRNLPDWARSPAMVQPDDPIVVVRRFADAADGPTEPTLQGALDRHRAGIVELADDGPLPVDDLRISGESRVVRARRGFRPIIRILRSRPGPALEQSAFVLLERKSLTIQGVDLIVDARDLSGKQMALFGCSGSSLTLRDCTITVINPTRVPFTLIRQEASPRRDRPSRIWLERTLIRGSAITLAQLSGGPTDLVVDGTAVRAGGAGPPRQEPPLIRASRPEGPDDAQRVFLAGALLICPGPVIRCDTTGGATNRGKGLAVRAEGSAIGRLQGPGIASLITSPEDQAEAGRVVEWSGDANLYAGWSGFFALGSKTTITVGGLAEARSTGNATERGSPWILADWPLSTDPARLLASGMSPFLLGWQALMARPAQPAPALFPKTIEVYPDPIVPQPASIAQTGQAGGFRPLGIPSDSRGGRPMIAAAAGVTGPAAGSQPATRAPAAPFPAAPAAGPERVFRTDDPRWAGDLGMFLRESIVPGARHVRVQVIGSGSHRFTPVRLPDGLTLEVRVEPDPTGSGLPSWSPAPLVTGPGLIDLRGGALVLSNLILRHDPSSGLESLLVLNDSHLVLYRCQFTVPPDTGAVSGDLVVFRAPTTRPVSDTRGNAVFLAPVDRPICRLIDTILIAHRTALRAQVGRGLVALTRCALASDDTAIELDPSRVARRSFEADLWLDRCTLVAARSIAGLGPWPGVVAGPTRPWLINSRRCVFLTLSDGRTRDAALLRFDADSFAGGGLFWQADGDVFELDRVVSGEDIIASSSRRNEVSYQWDQLFWPSNHATRAVVGPRAAALRLHRRLRPGRIEPGDLTLGALFPGYRGTPGVGADLPEVGGGAVRGVTGARPN